MLSKATRAMARKATASRTSIRLMPAWPVCRRMAVTRLLLRPGAATNQGALRRADRRGGVEERVVAPDPLGGGVVLGAARAAALPLAERLLAMPEVDDGATIGERVVAPVLEEADVVLELAIALTHRGFPGGSQREGRVDRGRRGLARVGGEVALGVAVVRRPVVREHGDGIGQHRGRHLGHGVVVAADVHRVLADHRESL